MYEASYQRRPLLVAHSQTSARLVLTGNPPVPREAPRIGGSGARGTGPTILAAIPGGRGQASAEDEAVGPQIPGTPGAFLPAGIRHRLSGHRRRRGPSCL